MRSSLPTSLSVLACFLFQACPSIPQNQVDAGRSITCLPCVESIECGDAGTCVQIGGSDACGKKCASASDCAADEVCQSAVAGDGTLAKVCTPKSGSCGEGPACPATCPPYTECNTVVGQCTPLSDAGGGDPCKMLAAPTESACCLFCVPGTAGCQANGCPGGTWCNRNTCSCEVAPAACTRPDAGTSNRDAGIWGTVTRDGGTVSRLYFAVVGDTRPAIIDDTTRYPSEIIAGIFQAIQAMNPRPQFVISTGDYVFASPISSQGAAQLAIYRAASNHFQGPMFPTLGNHECTSSTTINCVGTKAKSTLYQAYLNQFIGPMGYSLPYYAFDISGPQGAFTAKFIVTACNAWDDVQRDWVETQLKRPSTYTIVVRHIPLGVGAPCTLEMDPLLAKYPYTVLLVGHSHTVAQSGRQLIEGVGGAPITGNAVYGYATVEQLPSGAFQIVQWDYKARQAVATFNLP